MRSVSATDAKQRLAALLDAASGNQSLFAAKTVMSQ